MFDDCGIEGLRIDLHVKVKQCCLVLAMVVHMYHFNA